MKRLFGRHKKDKQSGGVNDMRPSLQVSEVDDDWQLLDEEGECTNYTPDTQQTPYVRLFAPVDRLVKRTDFQAIKTLGKGATGLVLLVRYKVDGQLYALKVVEKPKILKSGRPEDVVRERDIMRSSNWSNFLVKMHYCFQSKTKLFFVLDYMPGGDLYYYTGEWEGGHFDEATAKYYSASIYMGLQHLHNHKVVYRDLKPENVLLDADGNPKLADFGLSKELSNVDTIEERANSFVGTAFYIAPEILRKKQYDYSVDWWSYGVLVFNMLTGENPFYGDDCRAIFKAILQKNYSIRPEYHVSEEAQDLISRLLDKNPETRISGEDVKNHPWFEGFDWEGLGKGVAPRWRPIENPVPANIEGKTINEDSFSIKDQRLAEANQKLFADFTLDNTKENPLDSVEPGSMD
eukprot:TRINITY_DN3515_c1_g1_i1.p1 TRINITY_DN3515_c1_g1~~TRINITY_DN3515_c1_g1_i1.p1  ORF type:complete len:457 (+),score=147.20 TRINITY_DN3515_c1_g1_i1:159-1373(+)